MLPLRYTPPSSPWPTGEDVIDPDLPPYRVWIPESPLLVLGNSQTPEVELYLDNVRADGVPVYQRKGGGGAVYLDAGCVCVAIRFPKRDGWSIRDYFAAGNGLVARALGDAFGITAVQRGISDLAVATPSGERKVSGSSLYMPRECALYLASVLVNTPVGLLDRYLRHPGREPDYRGGRTHGDFLLNLTELDTQATPEAARGKLEKTIRESKAE